MGRTLSSRPSIRRLVVATAMATAAVVGVPGVAMAVEAGGPLPTQATPAPGPGGGSAPPTDSAPPAGNPAPPTAQPDPQQAAREQEARQQAARERARQERAREEQEEREREARQELAEAAAKRAFDEQLARQRAAEQLAREQAKEAKRLEEAAAAAVRARETWESRGRPINMVIVRETTIDVVAEGTLTAQAPRQPGVLTLPALDQSVPGPWLTMADAVARLSAVVILTPGAALQVGGDAVKTLELVGGATAPEAAALFTGGGQLTLRGVTVVSSDEASGKPMAPSAGRPFVVVSTGGRLDATDATLSDLGTPANDPARRAGVVFGSGSSGSLVRTTLTRNSIGLELDRSLDVRLDEVTVSEAASEGLVLRGDRGTSMSRIRAERNAANGVLVTGESTDRPVSGVTTTGNGAYGVALVGQTAPRVRGVTTEADGGGGLRLGRSTEVTVSDFTATDQPIGVLTHAGSVGSVLDRLRIVGGERGIVVEKSASEVELTATTIEGAGSVGVSVAGRGVDLRDVGVSESRTGVRIERGADAVTGTGLRLSGGKDGFVATPGTTGVILRDLQAEGVANTAVRTASRDGQIIGGAINGSTTGLDTAAATTITGTTVSAVDVGIRARSPELVTATEVDVAALTVGITVADGSPFVLAASRVNALEAVHGQVQQQGTNDLSLPPLNLLGAIGVPLILLAFVLEQVAALRQRIGGGHRRRLSGPPLPA